MLRVIAGKYRHQVLEAPVSQVTRPTKDRVREALFNIIQFEISGAIVLDLFAGSGATSIEFLSRGAAKALAVDQAPEAIAVMQRNCEHLKITNLVIIKATLPNYLERLRNTQYDFISLDPPYQAPHLISETLAQIVLLKLLKPRGYILIEAAAESRFEVPPSLMLYRHNHYGQSDIIILTNIL